MPYQSETSRKRRSQQHTADAPFAGIPLWSCLSIVAASLFTGMLLSVNGGTIGWLYFTFFILSALVTTLLVQPRGIFLMVASLPILFGIFTIAAGIGLVLNSPGEANGLSTTELITAIYPLLQHFPVLFIVTAGCAIIGFLRILLLKRSAARKAKSDHQRRLHDVEAEKRNRDTYSKSRSLAQRNSFTCPTGGTEHRIRRARKNNDSVTVDELVSRRRPRRERPQQATPMNKIESQGDSAWKLPEQKPQPERTRRPRRSFNDDLYS